MARRCLIMCKKFYDSQSGLYINYPGSAGIQIHELSFLNNHITRSFDSDFNKDAFFNSIKKYATSVEVDSESTDNVPWLRKNLSHLQIYFKAKSMDEIFEVAASTSNHIYIYSGIVIDFDNRETRCDDIFKQIECAIGKGLNVQANLKCDLSSHALSSSKLIVTTVNTIAALADIGTHRIILHPIDFDMDDNNVCEDVMRDVLEDAFNLDVIGDPMVERLGVMGDVKVVENAFALGCKHFITHSPPINLNIPVGNVSPRLPPFIGDIQHIIFRK